MYQRAGSPLYVTIPSVDVKITSVLCVLCYYQCSGEKVFAVTILYKTDSWLMHGV